MILVNFKTYQEGTGGSALKLVKILEEASKETGIKIIPVVQAGDLKEVTHASTLEVWVQNIDPISFGAHTGAVLPEGVIEDGAKGTFLNHSEKKFKSFEDLKLAVQRASDTGLKTLVFATDINEVKNIVTLKPTYVAYEPAELVGSTTTSVSQARPEIIAQAADITKQSGIPLIVGAGVHSQEDVRKALELGAVGVAVATDIVKSENPKKELLDLCAGYS